MNRIGCKKHYLEGFEDPTLLPMENGSIRRTARLSNCLWSVRRDEPLPGRQRTANKMAQGANPAKADIAGEKFIRDC